MDLSVIKSYLTTNALPEIVFPHIPKSLIICTEQIPILDESTDIELDVKTYKDYQNLIDQLKGALQLPCDHIRVKITSHLTRDPINVDIIRVFQAMLDS